MITQPHSQILDALGKPGPRGYHQPFSVPGYGYDGEGAIVATLVPDIAAEVDALNGWTEPDDLPAEHDASIARAAEFLGEILAWLASSESVHSAGLRAVALTFAVRPDLYGGRSLREIAAEWKLTRQAISKYTRQVVELAHGHFQHGTACRGKAFREACRQSAIRQHSRKNFHDD